MGKSLQTVGALALVAWTVLGAYAWSRAREGVRVVLDAGGDEPGTSEALVADRIEALSSDLDALIAALEANFAGLATALEGRGIEAAAVAARMEARLEELQRVLPAATPTTDPVAFAAAPVEDPPAPAEEPLRAKSFLAFALPSRDFRFEGEQTFDVLADLSRVGFDAKSTLHDFSGVSDSVRGRFRVDLAHASEGIDGSVTVSTTSLRTGLVGRDEAMLEHLAADACPEIEFVPTAFAPSHCDPGAKELDGVVAGRMTIHGVTREVEMALHARVDEARRLVLEGEMPLSLDDYGVEAPSQLGVISMQDEVRVWIHLRARAEPDGGTR